MTIKKEEFNGYEKWKEVAILFEELRAQYPERFYLVEYRHLLEKPLDSFRLLFNFCGIAFQNVTLDFIQKSTTDKSKKRMLMRYSEI